MRREAVCVAADVGLVTGVTAIVATLCVGRGCVGGRVDEAVAEMDGVATAVGGKRLISCQIVTSPGPVIRTVQLPAGGCSMTHTSSKASWFCPARRTWGESGVRISSAAV